MAKTAVIVARGLHPPWATGIASYGRILLETLASSGVYDRIELDLIPDWHRLRDPIEKTLGKLRNIGINVRIVDRRLIRRYKRKDVHVLAERTVATGDRVFKYFYVYPTSLKEATFTSLAANLLTPLMKYVVTSPEISRIYKVNGILLPPIPVYVDEWDYCEPRVIPPWDDYLLYIGWLRPERLPLKYLSTVIEEGGTHVVVFGRESESKYGEEQYAKLLRKKFGENIVVWNMVLKDCEKKWFIMNSRALLFPPETGYMNPPIVDPPLIVLETLYLGKPVIATPVLSIPWLAKECKLVKILDNNYDIYSLAEASSSSCSDLWNNVSRQWSNFIELLR